MLATTTLLNFELSLFPFVIQVARPQLHDEEGAEPEDADLGAGRLPARVAPDGGRATRGPPLLDGVGLQAHGSHRRNHREGGASGELGVREMQAPAVLNYYNLISLF